jgi:hypothetical protein
VLPIFEGSGNLSVGIHEATWEQLAARYGTTPHRQSLLARLKRARDSMRDAGCRRAYVDGSFVTAKGDPADFDVCWEESNVDPLLLDPVLMDFSEQRRAQKERFGGELFQATMPAAHDHADFLDYLQHARATNAPKGIVAIDLKDFHDHQRAPVQDHQELAEEVRRGGRPPRAEQPAS